MFTSVSDGLWAGVRLDDTEPNTAVFPSHVPRIGLGSVLSAVGHSDGIFARKASLIEASVLDSRIESIFSFSHVHTEQEKQATVCL